MENSKCGSKVGQKKKYVLKAAYTPDFLGIEIENNANIFFNTEDIKIMRANFDYQLKKGVPFDKIVIYRNATHGKKEYQFRFTLEEYAPMLRDKMCFTDLCPMAVVYRNNELISLFTLFERAYPDKELLDKLKKEIKTQNTEGGTYRYAKVLHNNNVYEYVQMSNEKLKKFIGDSKQQRTFTLVKKPIGFNWPD